MTKSVVRNRQKSRARKMLNPQTGEFWFCENIDDVRLIDGVPFLVVSREPGQRVFLMAKDGLRVAENGSKVQTK